MTADRRIVDAAREVLKRLGGPATINQLYEAIVTEGLYTFNTPTPEHVLRTTVRRHTKNVERTDSRAEVLFEMVADEVYVLIDDTSASSRDKRTVPGTRRIYRATDKEQIISALTANQAGVFREIWRLLMFSAHVGLKAGRRERLGAIDTGRGIDQSTFGNSPAWPGVLYLIGLVETDNSSILSGAVEAEDERLAAFQEYANGGLSVLADFFAHRSVNLDGLLEFIETQRTNQDTDPDLSI